MDGHRHELLFREHGGIFCTYLGCDFEMDEDDILEFVARHPRLDDYIYLQDYLATIDNSELTINHDGNYFVVDLSDEWGNIDTVKKDALGKALKRINEICEEVLLDQQELSPARESTTEGE